jgi:uncharacterized protein (TIGR03083 family)
MSESIDHARAITDESSRFAAALPDDLSAPVPTCPAWDAQALVEHLGEVQYFWATILGQGPQRPEDIELPDPPSDRSGLLEWFAGGTDALVTAIGRVAPADPTWTWWGEPATAGAVARHQVQEAAVHRVDAELITGVMTPLPLPTADDGVGEFLQVMLDIPESEAVPRVRLHATDSGSDWQVGDATPAVTVNGPASDLVLTLYGRIRLDGLAVDGDRDEAVRLLRMTAAGS